jgi:hypothetical protein
LAICAAGLATAIACWQFWRLGSALAARLTYPIALEWMEEGELYESYRLLHGLPIYGPPSQHFLPYPYPPLHVAVVAALGSVLGLDYVLGRLVSIAGLVAIAVMAALVAASRAPSKAVGVGLAAIAAGSIATGYPVTGALIDTVRLDAMAMALIFAAALLVPTMETAPPSWRRVLAIASLLTASVYTKQTAIFFAAWILVFALARDRRTGLRMAVLTLCLSAAPLCFLQAITHGWFWFWLMHTSGHSIAGSLLGVGIARVLWHAPFVGLLPLLIVVRLRAERLSGECVFWAGMLVAALVATFLPLLKEGGSVNNLVPIVAIAWPATIVLVRSLPAPPGAIGLAMVGTGALTLALQHWEPHDFAPSESQRAGAEAFARAVHELNGGVLSPIFPFFTVHNSEPVPQIALVAYLDARAANMTVSPGEAVDASRARWLLFTGYECEEWVQSTTRHYRFARDLDVGGEPLMPRGSAHKTLWERIDPPNGSQP